jgi:hypothetical protein
MKNLSVSRQPYYRKSDLWTLFLMAAFPTHVWTIIIVLSDIEWVSERTNLWDAVGVGAYGLIVAAIESVFVFVLATALGFLISRYWSRSARVSLLTALVILVALWAIFEQLFLVLPIHIPDFLFNFLVHSGHPLRYIYLASIFFSVGTVLPLCYVILRFKMARTIMEKIIERLSILTLLYLVLDAGAVVIVLMRNF